MTDNTKAIQMKVQAAKRDDADLKCRWCGFRISVANNGGALRPCPACEGGTMKVINLFGGPGAGKSTTAAGVFWLLKNRGLRVELVTEYAKALAWAKRGEELTDQFYIYAKQHHRQHVLRGQVDFCVTDSPLLLPLLYNQTEPPSFRQYVEDNWNRYDNINFFICRAKPYVALGRWQTEEEANELHDRTFELLLELEVGFDMVKGDESSAVNIINMLEGRGIL